MRRIDHRVDGIDELRQAARRLRDADVACRRETEHVYGHPHPLRAQAFGRVVHEARDRPTRVAAARLGENGVLDRPVARKPDVIELDFGEARAGGRAPDRDVVIPDSLVVRVDPAEACVVSPDTAVSRSRSEEHTSELQSPMYLVCRLLLEKKKNITIAFFFQNNKKKKKKIN